MSSVTEEFLSPDKILVCMTSWSEKKMAFVFLNKKVFTLYKFINIFIQFNTWIIRSNFNKIYRSDKEVCEGDC